MLCSNSNRNGVLVHWYLLKLLIILGLNISSQCLISICSIHFPSFSPFLPFWGGTNWIFSVFHLLYWLFGYKSFCVILKIVALEITVCFFGLAHSTFRKKFHYFINNVRMLQQYSDCYSSNFVFWLSYNYFYTQYTKR